MKKLTLALIEIITKFVKDGCSIYAASLTYITLLALVPFLIVFFKILSLFTFFRAYINEIESYIFHNLIVTSANVLEKNIITFVQKGAQLSILSVLALVVTLILMAINVNTIFNRIWHTEQNATVFQYLKYALMIILLPIAVGLLLFVSNLFMQLPYASWISSISEPLISMVALFCLYYFTPSCKINFYAAGISALIVLLLFMSAKNFFSFYISHFSNYEFLYGVFSVIPIFLVWLYTIWIIVLLGVVMSYVLTKHYFDYDA